jgi:hypothetical protein
LGLRNIRVVNILWDYSSTILTTLYIETYIKRHVGLPHLQMNRTLLNFDARNAIPMTIDHSSNSMLSLSLASFIRYIWRVGTRIGQRPVRLCNEYPSICSACHMYASANRMPHAAVSCCVTIRPHCETPQIGWSRQTLPYPTNRARVAGCGVLVISR